jgi:hypothetical protein
MKLKSAILAIPTLFLFGCDSAEDSNVFGDISRTPEAQAFVFTEFLEGDAFRFSSISLPKDPDVFFPDTASTNPETFPEGEDHNVEGDGSLELNTVNFNYEVLDDYSFIWRGFPDTRDDLEEALTLILGSPGLINSEFRNLMLKTDLNQAELQRVVEILRQQNVDVRLLTNGEIIGLEQVIVYHRIDSKNKHLLDAEMFGRYTIEERFFRLKFALATQEQIDSIRLLTPSHHVPFPDSLDPFVIEDFQTGVWNVTLANQDVERVNPPNVGNNPGTGTVGVGGAGTGTN